LYKKSSKSLTPPIIRTSGNYDRGHKVEARNNSASQGIEGKQLAEWVPETPSYDIAAVVED